MFRATSRGVYLRGSSEVEDSTETNIEVPIDLIEASEVTVSILNFKREILTDLSSN